MDRTYDVTPSGKKFATVCRTDGYWSITYLSKNTRAARRKGEEFVSGKRTAMRKYITPYGEYMNTARSLRLSDRGVRTCLSIFAPTAGKSTS